MFSRKAKVLFQILMLLALSLSAYGDEIDIPVTDFALIRHGNSEFRLLINFELPEQVTDTSLSFSELTFRIIPDLSGDSLLKVEAFPITTPWESDDVSWNQPWQNRGGDYLDIPPAMHASSNNEEFLANFDVTEIVRAWLSGTYENNGLIFIIPTRIQSRFTLGNDPEMSPNAIANVKFIF